MYHTIIIPDTINENKLIAEALDKTLCYVAIDSVFLNSNTNENHMQILTIVLAKDSLQIHFIIEGIILKFFTVIPNVTCKLYDYTSTEEALKDGNLYLLMLVKGIPPIYMQKDSGLQQYSNPVILKKLTQKAEKRYNRFINNALALSDGILYYLENKEFQHAAALLFQYLHLLFRVCSEIFTGRQHSEVSIIEWQACINSYRPGFVKLFEPNNKKDSILASKLLKSYKDTCFNSEIRFTFPALNDFYIKTEQFYMDVFDMVRSHFVIES
ncbi:hypothetical protein Q765_13075 [Flavobacterium rivuli WB 3.3-2 = DSM 21788]|uniref:HEPN domain-containing protein n=1 Tax=Flavobacterium rivuli WB 3.3-2 = DSM 21788 TaxID=1121895 RepID=A0A0A2MCH9_9FLAO|nr:hypothetical protein [Flavobacterium rivuli]KGO85990.1 hypothetical protein Q765_13075 [Flavobacterium rivuli WB 3.3-2 = DSM 21788]